MLRPRPAVLRRAQAGSLLALAGVWLLASACGPGAATPMPEPPIAFDLGAINNTELTPATEPKNPEAVVFAAGAKAVPAGAVVRITNLDRTTETTAANATPLGSFEAIALVTDGQELRFEWTSGDERSAPADAIFVQPDPTVRFRLEPSPRFACLKLTPGLVLDFAGASSATLGFENGCDQAVVVTNARTRLGLTDFALPAAPPEIPASESAEITVNFNRSVVGLREDVLLLDVTLGSETIRYPVTLRAEN
jgi:hypothetical protein